MGPGSYVEGAIQVSSAAPAGAFSGVRMSLNLFDPVTHSNFSPQSTDSATAANFQVVPPQCSARLAFICRFLCIAGLAISGYLAWTTLNTEPAIGCGSDGVVDCGHVLDSKWSKVWGVPVSIPAVTLYMSLLALLCFVRQPAPIALQRSLWTLLTLGFLMAGAAAVWFVSLQIVEIGHICPWCMATHSCSLILAAVALWNTIIPSIRKQQAFGSALAAVAVLAMVQLNSEEPIPAGEDVSFDSLSSVAEATGESTDLSSGDLPATTDGLNSVPAPLDIPADANAPAADPAVQIQSPAAEPQASFLQLLSPRRLVTAQLNSLLWISPAPDELQPTDTPASTAQNPNNQPAPQQFSITLKGKTFNFQTDSEPMIGAASPQFMFLEMSDYTCPHCRANHATITKVLGMKKYAGLVAAIVVPLPLDRACNPATSSAKPGACELARLALAVYEADSAKFPGFHDWLMLRARTPGEARSEADRLVGTNALNAALAEGQPNKDLARNSQLYQTVGGGVVPKLIFQNSLRNGGITQNDLMARIDQALVNPQPPKTAPTAPGQLPTALPGQQSSVAPVPAIR